MSIDLSALVDTAFKTVGANVDGGVREVTYRAAGAQTYDPGTGSVTTASADYVIEAILTAYKRQEKETDFQSSRRQVIEFGDQKCLIPYASLPIEPSMEDVILIGDKTWRIVNHTLDPTGKALHTFQLRQS